MSNETIACPRCGVKIKSANDIPDGTRLTCPRCQAKFTAGEESPPAAAPVAVVAAPVVAKPAKVVAQPAKAVVAKPVVARPVRAVPAAVVDAEVVDATVVDDPPPETAGLVERFRPTRGILISSAAILLAGVVTSGSIVASALLSPPTEVVTAPAPEPAPAPPQIIVLPVDELPARREPPKRLALYIKPGLPPDQQETAERLGAHVVGKWKRSGKTGGPPGFDTVEYMQDGTFTEFRRENGKFVPTDGTWQVVSVKGHVLHVNRLKKKTTKPDEYEIAVDEYAAGAFRLRQKTKGIPEMTLERAK